MKLLKSKKEIDEKRKGGRTKETHKMSPEEEVESYGKNAI